MTHVNDPAVIERLLRTKGRWAIVGLTTNQWRAAYDTSLFIRDRLGMEIIPVNLPADPVHGETGYAPLADIPAAKQPHRRRGLLREFLEGGGRGGPGDRGRGQGRLAAAGRHR